MGIDLGPTIHQVGVKANRLRLYPVYTFNKKKYVHVCVHFNPTEIRFTCTFSQLLNKLAA